jgi:DNA-binding phage protein
MNVVVSHNEEDDVRVEAFIIAGMMNVAGLPSHFIVQAVDLSDEFEGILDLLRLWRDETEEPERDAIVADIQELIDDCSQTGKVEAPYVRFDDLDRIAADVRAFKDSLRILVDERGGISRLAETTGIPQPSLSRFFSSASMPRRTTLYKIARALNLSHVQIASPWSV